MSVETIKNTLVARQFGGCEWEASRERAGVHVAINAELIGADGERGVETLLHLYAGRLRVDQACAEDRFNFTLHEIELFEVFTVDREI